MHRLLGRLDPASATRIHSRDTQKIIRALEVCLLARRPMSTMLARGRRGLRGFRPIKIGLNPNRAQLRDRIDRRVEQMFAGGLISEACVNAKSPSRLIDRLATEPFSNFLSMRPVSSDTENMGAPPCSSA